MNKTRIPLGRFILLGIGVIAFAVSAKLALVQLFGTDQPYADQWAAEGMYFVRGPLYYDITFAQIFTAHGEHRPAFTRLWTMGLVKANGGQWDCFVELVANLLIYGAYLGIIWSWLVPLVPARWLAWPAICMALLFALPCSYENFLWGFQSGFLSLLLFGACHIQGTLSSRRLGPRWLLAQGAGLAGLFSVAAGVISSAVVVFVSGLQLLRGERNAWAWSTFVTGCALFAFGYWLIPVNDALPVSIMSRLLQGYHGVGYLLSWPFEGYWVSVLIHAPWIFMLVRYCCTFHQPSSTREGDMMVAAMGLWTAGMAFAIATGRAITAETVGVRYYDGLVLATFVNVPALVRITSVAKQSRKFWLIFGVAWVCAIGWGIAKSNRPQNLGPMFEYQLGLAVEQRLIVQDFLTTGDPAKLTEFANRTGRFPHLPTTLDFLRDPKVRPILPPTLTADGHANRLSRVAQSIARHWGWLMFLGVFLIIWEGWKSRRK